MSTAMVNLPDGAGLAVTTSGAGRDLVLVTGLGGTAAFWDPVVPLLEPHFRVTRFDQRGIGASDRGTAEVSIGLLAEDTRAVLEHLDARDAVLLGHSTGGVILQELALRDSSRVGGLVLSGTWAKPNRYMTELFRSRSVLLEKAPQEYAAMGAFLGYTPDWLEANWTRFEAVVAAAPTSRAAQKVVAERIAALLAFDRSKDVGSISPPVLIQGAEDDLIVPAFLQRELAELIPQAKLDILPSGGHFFPLTRPAEFLKILTRWTGTLD
ncbi:MAG TPA: alpha/beta hydrolase [Hyphomicrobiaceae bacterium]|jgi:pimeloyl-ACP methyl ester carboxylesterase